MKRIIRVVKANGQIEYKELKLRDKDHFEAQLKFPSKTTKNKKKYNRKEKHKKINHSNSD